MNADWKSFLSNKGAEFEGDVVASFGNLPIETQVVHSGDVLSDLSQYGLISAHGPDAVSFLQGQLTNDLHKVNATNAALNGLCSSKGRLLSNFLVFKRGEILYLFLPVNTVETVLRLLRVYVMRAKLTLENATHSLLSFGCSGPHLEKELESLGYLVPHLPYAATVTKNVTLIRLSSSKFPRYVAIGELDDLKRLWGALEVRAAPVGIGAWQLLDIQAGIAVVLPETSDMFVPQMLNWQRVGGVSFKKGCYTGQEVVARMEYLGKLKRRMYRALVRTNDAPKPGDKLYSIHFENNQSCGNIVNAQASAEGGFEVLAVIDSATQAKQDVHWGSVAGPRLEDLTLPYSFEADSVP